MRNKMGGKSGAAKKKKRNQTEAELKSRHKIKSRCQISKSADTNFSEIKEGPKVLSFAPDIDFFSVSVTFNSSVEIVVAYT